MEVRAQPTPDNGFRTIAVPASVKATGASGVGFDQRPFTTAPKESTHASPVPTTWATETGSPTGSTSPGLIVYGTNHTMTLVGATWTPPSTTWGVPLLTRFHVLVTGS